MANMHASLFLLLLALNSSYGHAESCRSLREGPGVSVSDCGGVHVLRLSGDPTARARLLGSLVRSGALSGTPLRYFTNKIADVAREETGWLATPILLAYNQLIRLFHRDTPASFVKEIDAMALSLGLDPIELRRGLSLPDTASFVQGLGSYKGLEFIPAMGCTSVVARTAQGGFAYGRNLDFAGVGTWDRHPMILAVEPPTGSSELRHLVIGADGVPFAGITGVNEAGITFAVHQNYTRDISLHGVPMVLIGELVMRSAHTIEEAVATLRANRPASLWTFVLTDLSRGRALAVESSQRVFLTREMEGPYFVQANHAMHAESQERENAPAGVEMNSRFRMEQAMRLMNETAPSGAGSLAKILAWQASPLGELTAYRDILKANTLQTAIFEKPAKGEASLSLSVDPAPASSGRYARFPLAQFWKSGAVDWQPEDYTATTPDVRRRQTTSTAAYRLYFDDRKVAEAAAMMAAQKTFDAALFRCIAMANAGRYSDSLRMAEEALRDPRFTGEPSHVRESFERVKFISLLQLHHHEEARAFAQSVLESKEQGLPGPSKQKLAALAARYLRHESIPGWMLALHFDFFSGDLNGRKD